MILRRLPSGLRRPRRGSRIAGHDAPVDRWGGLCCASRPQCRVRRVSDRGLRAPRRVFSERVLDGLGVDGCSLVYSGVRRCRLFTP